MDEAGQSPEPDILIPWTQFNLNLKGQVVLAGDPHQLGPVGRKHALKKYDQFALNTSCFWASTRSNIIPVMCNFMRFLLQK